MFLYTDNAYYLMFAHILLSYSSLFFKISNMRHKSLNIIYPELRLHSILFATRSFICYMLSYYNYSYKYKMVTCILTMILADLISYNLNSKTTTIRNLPGCKDETPKEKLIVSRMYAESQAAATLFMIYNIETAFLPMFAIQIAAFLMTLVKKGFINNNMSRLIYSLALWINIPLMTTLTFFQNAIFILCILIFKYMRIKHNLSKYRVWLINFIIVSLTYDIDFVVNSHVLWLISLVIFIRYIYYSFFIVTKFC